MDTIVGIVVVGLVLFGAYTLYKRSRRKPTTTDASESDGPVDYDSKP